MSETARRSSPRGHGSPRNPEGDIVHAVDLAADRAVTQCLLSGPESVVCTHPLALFSDEEAFKVEEKFLSDEGAAEDEMLNNRSGQRQPAAAEG